MMIVIVIVIVISIIFIDLVFVDSNTPICAATDSLADRRDVAACSDNRDRGHLGDEDEVTSVNFLIAYATSGIAGL
jgi:hypothetical protein